MTFLTLLVLPVLVVSFTPTSLNFTETNFTGEMMACSLDIVHCSSVSANAVTRYTINTNGGYNITGSTSISDCAPCTVTGNYMSDDGSRQIVYVNTSRAYVYSHTNGSLSYVQYISFNPLQLVGNSPTIEMTYPPKGDSILIGPAPSGRRYIYIYNNGTQRYDLGYHALSSAYLEYFYGYEPVNDLLVAAYTFSTFEAKFLYYWSVTGVKTIASVSIANPIENLIDLALSYKGANVSTLIIGFKELGMYNLYYYTLTRGASVVLTQAIIANDTAEIRMIYLTRSGQFLTVVTATQGQQIYEHDPIADQFVLIQTVTDPAATISQWNRLIISEDGSQIYRGHTGTGVLFSSSSGTSSGGTTTNGTSTNGTSTNGTSTNSTGGNSSGGTSGSGSTSSANEVSEDGLSSTQGFLIGFSVGGLLIVIVILVVCIVYRSIKNKNQIQNSSPKKLVPQVSTNQDSLILEKSNLKINSLKVIEIEQAEV